MYEVQNGLGWSIVQDNEVVLNVTSEHYAHYLCNQLNNGTTLEDIKNRKYPDLDYFAYCRELDKQ